MALRRFYVEGARGERVVIGGDLFHHIRDVCRFQVGDRFEVLPGDGLAILVEIDNVGSRELSATAVSSRQLSVPAKPWLTLALSIPKLPKVDWIVEKCVELGVHEIRPFVSDYSFLRKLSEISTNRLERWQKLVNAATQQSGRGDVMKIPAPTSLPLLLEEFNRSAATYGLFPYEGEGKMGLAQALSEIKKQQPERIWVFVGSEGGFSAAEVQLFARHGMEPVSLGERILRVETACLALSSIIKYETGAF